MVKAVRVLLAFEICWLVVCLVMGWWLGAAVSGGGIGVAYVSVLSTTSSRDSIYRSCASIDRSQAAAIDRLRSRSDSGRVDPVVAAGMAFLMLWAAFVTWAAVVWLTGHGL